MRNTKRFIKISKGYKLCIKPFKQEERREFAYQERTKVCPSYYWNLPWIYFDREHQKYMLF